MASRKRILAFTAIGIAIAGAVGINLVAWRQVALMTQFVNGRSRTRPPEKLNLLSKVRVIATGVSIPRPENTRNPQDLGLEYTRHELQTSREDRLEAWMIDPPNAKGIFLLFHGYASSKDSLLPIADALVKLGYAAFLVDFYGSGGSEGNSTPLLVAGG